MADKKKNAPLPASSAGLLRFFDESISTLKIMQNKLEKLSKQLEKEEDPAKQQEFIKTIDSLISVIDKLNKK